MRCRLLLLAVASGTLVLGACSDQTQSPTEPTVPPPAQNFGSCPVARFPLLDVARQIRNIYPFGPLRTEALLRAAAVALLWDTCHPAAARRAAFSFIDWLNRHTPAGKEDQVKALILTILRGIGEVDVPASDGDFGIGFFDPDNDENTVITTLNHHALISLEPGSFLVPTVIVISRKAGDPPLTDFEGNQYPPTYDYNAINSTNNHVLQPGKTAIVAFCLVYIGPPTMPGNGYAANLGIGHNPVFGAPNYPFEILEPFDLEESPLRSQLNCPGIDDVIGSTGGGLQNFANAALRTAGSFLLPQPLWATTLGTLPPPPPLGGRAPSLSPFRPVDATNFFGFENGELEWTPTGFWNRNTLVGLTNSAFPTYVSTVGNALPAPFAGSFAAWYGQASRGNYLGTQVSNDAAGSGGTSTAPNTGSLVSPSFTVPDVTNAVELRFKTWWEIESVNPSTFDLMKIILRDGETETPLDTLNPTSDPGTSSSALAYTSGGFNAAPEWQDVTIDLSAYRGHTVQLGFVFDTRDNLYNGFRGWILDQVVVGEVTGASPPVSLRLSPQQGSTSGVVPGDHETVPVRTWRP